MAQETRERSLPDDAPAPTNAPAPTSAPVNAPAPRRSSTARWLPLLLIPLLGAGFYGWTKRGQKTTETTTSTQGGGAGAGKRDELKTVAAVAVTQGSISQLLDVTGNLKSNQNIDLGSKINGRVARVLVDEGSRITRGQLLVELESDDLRAQIESARANLSTAQARYRQAVAGLPARETQVSTNIQQAQSALQSAEARYRQALLSETPAIRTAQIGVSNARQTVRTAQARLNQARQTARQADLETRAQIASAQAVVRSAQAVVAQAEARLAEVRRGARDQQVAQAQAQVNLAEAQVRNAETELNRARILVEGGASPRATLDTAQTAYDVARANLEAARQNLSLVREGATNEQVTQAQEALRQAQQGVPQAQAGLAQAQAGRSRVLVAQGEVTQALAALTQAQGNFATAQANLAQIPITQQGTRVAKEAVDQARSALLQARANRSQIPVAREDVNAARAGVQVAQAALKTAQVNLGYARIYSPVNGVVNQKLTAPGQTAGLGSPLLNLVSLDRVYFEAQVSENNVNRVRVGQPATIYVASISDKPMTGYVSDIIPTATTTLRQFRVRITIPNAPRELTPGAFARGTITTQRVSNALLVPEEAILRSSEQKPALLALVGSPNNATVKKRTVQTGIQNAGKTQVLGGVRQGDLVVLNDHTLSDGDKVRVAKNN